MAANSRYLMRPAPAQHGSPSLYDKGCRCAPCIRAKRTYCKRRAYLVATGRWNPWGDLDAARAHLARHQALGVGASRVADAAGVNRSTAYAIANGSSTKAFREVVDKILAVEVEPLPGAKVSAVGSTRRVRALMAIGYTQPVIGRHAGITRAVMTRISVGEPRVTADAVRRVMRTYDELSMTPAPVSQSSKVALAYARKYGWLPPLAWDDDLIDLPDAELDAELRRRASLMSDVEAHRCYRAQLAGDRSPLIVAGGEEYRERRKHARRKGVAA